MLGKVIHFKISCCPKMPLLLPKKQIISFMKLINGSGHVSASVLHCIKQRCGSFATMHGLLACGWLFCYPGFNPVKKNANFLKLECLLNLLTNLFVMN